MFFTGRQTGETRFSGDDEVKRTPARRMPTIFHRLTNVTTEFSVRVSPQARSGDTREDRQNVVGTKRGELQHGACQVFFTGRDMSEPTGL